MAAALKVSAAPKTTDLFLSLKSLPSFPIVVVLPTPLTPEITMIVDLLFPKSDKFFSYLINLLKVVLLKFLKFPWVLEFFCQF